MRRRVRSGLGAWPHICNCMCSASTVERQRRIERESEWRLRTATGVWAVARARFECSAHSASTARAWRACPKERIIHQKASVIDACTRRTLHTHIGHARPSGPSPDMHPSLSSPICPLRTRHTRPQRSQRSHPHSVTFSVSLLVCPRWRELAPAMCARPRSAHLIT